MSLNIALVPVLLSSGTCSMYTALVVADALSWGPAANRKEMRLLLVITWSMRNR